MFQEKTETVNAYYNNVEHLPWKIDCVVSVAYYAT